MAVPNTNTFSLQDVRANIVEAPNNLVSCFNGAASKGFVAAYACLLYTSPSPRD